jgi:hypothetical protein
MQNTSKGNLVCKYFLRVEEKYRNAIDQSVKKNAAELAAVKYNTNKFKENNDSMIAKLINTMDKLEKEKAALAAEKTELVVLMSLAIMESLFSLNLFVLYLTATEKAELEEESNKIITELEEENKELNKTVDTVETKNAVLAKQRDIAKLETVRYVNRTEQMLLDQCIKQARANGETDDDEIWASFKRSTAALKID